MTENAHGAGHDLLVELTADIVAAYVSHHVVPVGDLANLISDVHSALSNTSSPVPVVSVLSAMRADFVDTVPVTGSFAAREEILVAPEVDGMRVLEIRAEVGDRVKKGDVLARLVTEQIEAQIAANDAALASAAAAIARSQSLIVEQ